MERSQNQTEGLHRYKSHSSSVLVSATVQMWMHAWQAGVIHLISTTLYQTQPFHTPIPMHRAS